LAVRVPVWLTLGVAVLVLVFGAYRIRLALHKPEPESEAGAGVMGRGFYRMSPRTHLLIGVVYILLAAGLIATSFGWNPFGNAFGPDTKAPAKDQAPTNRGVPIDQLPAKKPS
jgi:protein-S-isoprenylcysteine O-methyltransferase Ste14